MYNTRDSLRIRHTYATTNTATAVNARVNAGPRRTRCRMYRIPKGLIKAPSSLSFLRSLLPAFLPFSDLVVFRTWSFNLFSVFSFLVHKKGHAKGRGRDRGRGRRKGKERKREKKDEEGLRSGKREEREIQTAEERKKANPRTELGYARTGTNNEHEHEHNHNHNRTRVCVCNMNDFLSSRLCKFWSPSCSFTTMYQNKR